MECALWVSSVYEESETKEERIAPQHERGAGAALHALSRLLILLHPHARRSDWIRGNGSAADREVLVLRRWTARSNSMRANIGVQGRRHQLDVLLRISWSALIWAQWRPKYTLLDESKREEEEGKNQSHNRVSCWRGIKRELVLSLRLRPHKMTCNSVTLGVLMPSFPNQRGLVKLHYS